MGEGPGVRPNTKHLTMKHQITPADIASFKTYITEFYGPNGIYEHFFKPLGATEQEIDEAIAKYIASLNNDTTWGGGDSTDRERVREIMLQARGLTPNFKDGGGVEGFARGGGIKNTLEKLYDIDGKAYEYAKANSGGELYSSPEMQLKYKMYLDEAIAKAKLKLPLSMKIHEELQDANYHSLNQYLYLSGAYGPEEKQKWVSFLKEKPRTYFLDYKLYENQPSKTFTGKIPMKEIKIHWVEGKQRDKFPKTFTSWTEANEFLKFYTPGDNEGYNKAKFTVTFEDGDQYQDGRVDLSPREDNPYATNNVIGKHIYDYLTWLVNNSKSTETLESKREIQKYLNTYDLGIQEPENPYLLKLKGTPTQKLVDAPKELKGYGVNIYKHYDSAQNTISGKFDRIVLVTDGVNGDSSTVMSDKPYIKLVKRELFGKTHLSAVPVNDGKDGKHHMMGGNFVWSSDSRFRTDINEYPIPLHDRVEDYEKGGNVNKTIKVTENNVNDFLPYQGTTKKLKVGDVVYVVKTVIPETMRQKTFSIVTDWEPNYNTLKMIERANDPEADKYGWKRTAELNKEAIAEKKEAIYFNRWSINDNKYEKAGSITGFGDNVFINDPKSLYSQKSGVIIGDEGNMWLVKTISGTGLVHKNKVQKIENNFADGGPINGKHDFTEADFEKLKSNPAFDVNLDSTTGLQYIYNSDSGSKLLGKFNPKENYIYIYGPKDTTNPLVQYLQTTLNSQPLTLNLLPLVAKHYPKTVKDYGVTEAFIDPFGEFRLTSNYPVPFDTATEIEHWVLTNHKPTFETGGDINEYPVKITLKSKFGPKYNQDWYIRKLDATHFYLSNNPTKKGEPVHVGQYKDMPFYTDVKNWLSGNAVIDGKIYESDKFQNGGSIYGIEKHVSQNILDHISSLDKEQLEKMKGELVSEINRSELYDKDSNRLISLKKELNLINHRLELDLNDGLNNTFETGGEITAEYVGEDDWNRKLYKASDGVTYASVDGQLYVLTDEGEPLYPTRKNIKITTDAPNNDYKHTYMMLGRLQSDNDYFLGYGNRNEKRLWAGSVDAQITEMKRLWNELPENKKPEWLSYQDILDYETKMKEQFSTGGGVSDTAIPYQEFITHTTGVIDLTKSRQEHAKQMAQNYAKQFKKRVTPRSIEYFETDAGAYHKVRDILETIPTTNFSDVVAKFKELYPLASDDWKRALRTGLVIKADKKEGNYSNGAYIYNDDLATRIREAGINKTQPIIQEILDSDQFASGGKVKNIDEETTLLPEAMAQGIAETSAEHILRTELQNWDKLNADERKALDEKYLNLTNKIADYLVLRANTTYKHNEKYRKEIKKDNNAALNYMEKFMRHWAGFWGDKWEGGNGKLEKSIERYYADVKAAKKEQGGTVNDLEQRINAEIKKHKADPNHDEYGDAENEIFEEIKTTYGWGIYDNPDAESYMLKATAPERLQYVLDNVLPTFKKEHGGYAELKADGGDISGSKTITVYQVFGGFLQDRQLFAPFLRGNWSDDKQAMESLYNSITEKDFDLTGMENYGKDGILLIELNSAKVPKQVFFQTQDNQDILEAVNYNITHVKERGIYIDGTKASKKELNLELHGYRKGGSISFEKLEKKVAKQYVGKPVPKKYQAEYGKTYSKEEAKVVGIKVANKVKNQKQRNKIASKLATKKK